MNRTRAFLAIISLFALSACGTAFDPEHRKNATYNIVEGGDCPSGEYILVVDKHDSKQGWKSQREFVCKQGSAAQLHKSLDGKTYTKAQLKQQAESDQFVHNLFMP